MLWILLNIFLLMGVSRRKSALDVLKTISDGATDNLSLCLVKTRLVMRKHLIPPSSMDNICSLLFMIEVSHRPHNRQLPVWIFGCHKLWIAILMRKKPNPTWEHNIQLLKPHHATDILVVLFLMPLCCLRKCMSCQFASWHRKKF